MKRIELPDLDNLVERYIAGETAAEIAQSIGVSTNTVLRRVKARGVALRPSHTRRRIVVPGNVIDEYIAGEPVMVLARRHHIHEAIIRRELRARDIAVRPGNAYAPNVAAAHEAVRGRKRSVVERSLGASTNERRQLHTSIYEDQFSKLLDDLGIEHLRQRAIGVYNIDLVLTEPPIAVEIRGGGGGSHRSPHREQRIKHLLGEGWSVLDVLVRYGSTMRPVTTESAQYLVAFAEQLRGNPPPRGEHRVVWADGKRYAGQRLYVR